MNMKAADLLLEIGTEELPAQGLQELAQAFKEKFVQQLQQAQLSYLADRYWVTPRRLAIGIEQLVAEQPEQRIERRGPALTAAFDAAGNPTKAALGFAHSCGVSVDRLTVFENGKGRWLGFKGTQAGKKTTEVLPGLIQAALKRLVLAKSMRWGWQEKPFIRPVHWLVVLYGTEVVPVHVLGVSAQRQTYGHRFHYPEPILLHQPQDYVQSLRDPGKVVVDFTERREYIKQKVIAMAANYQGEAIIQEELLDEVTGLVEYPVVLCGQFKEEYLQLPKEVLLASLHHHQKCFAIADQSGALLPRFIIVSNIESKKPEEVIAGNERVVAARLSDAQFFYYQDRQFSLQQRIPDLDKVLFQQQLGTLGDKAKRLSQLTPIIAKELGVDSELAQRAGLLAKTDLLTDMVKEFPELQGIMGYYYAIADGEPIALAQALYEHYLPRFAGDGLPESLLGCALALADRLDTLVGSFAIGKIPSGNHDPFGLRRAALGLIRLLLDKQLPLDLAALIKTAHRNYPTTLAHAEIMEPLLTFIWERLRHWYLEQAVPHEVVNAVLATAVTVPWDIHLRVQAVLKFQTLPEAEQLIAANKRVSQLLRKTEELGEGIVDNALLENTYEQHLYQQVRLKQQAIAQLLAHQRYTEVMQTLAELQPTVDQFFDNVMVMVEDSGLRNNRLALLTQLRELFTQVADISLL